MCGEITWGAYIKILAGLHAAQEPSGIGREIKNAERKERRATERGRVGGKGERTIEKAEENTKMKIAGARE